MRNQGPPSNIRPHTSRNQGILQRRQTPKQEHNAQTSAHQGWKRLGNVEVAEDHNGGAHAHITDTVGLDESKVDFLLWSQRARFCATQF